MRRTMTAAVREFRSTALTPAFLFGAVIFPLVIWAAMIGVSMLKIEKPKLKGTLAVVDQTSARSLGPALVRSFDREELEKQSRAMRQAVEQMAAQQAAKLGISEQQFKQQTEMAIEMMGLATDADVTVELVPDGADLPALRQKAKTGEILALVTLDEVTMALDPSKLAPPPEAEDKDDPSRRGVTSTPDAAGPGTYEFVQGAALRPDHARTLRSTVERVVRDERYRRAGVDPTTVRALSQLPVQARSVVVTDAGERTSNDALTRLLPLIFMMLIYMAAMTGGNYLFYGTLEEKSSRVMEVILSAVSARELLIGKIIGQGLVGLAVLGIYGGLGMAAASRFGVLGQVPVAILPWALVYFLMAYCLIGALMLAVGSAVTEIREAQALFTPITIIIILPFMLMFPIMQNPGSVLARATSFFPPTTPYVMVMRLSQPSHVIPLWELIATTVVGFLGVGVVIWAAAKVFRVGILMYGKPPSFMGLLKWVRQA